MTSSDKGPGMEQNVNDLLHCKLQTWTFPPTIEASWLGDGILQLLPKKRPGDRRRCFSAGVHGNETAPIEMLLQILQGIKPRANSR